MASSSLFLISTSILFLLTVNLSPSIAQTSFRPKALVLPVKKDASTLQYVTTFSQRTPLVPLKLTVDLGGGYLWVDCLNGYVSSTYKNARCGSAPCSLADAKFCLGCDTEPKPGCYPDTCYLIPDNPFIRMAMISQVGQDVVSLRSTDGFNPGRTVTVPNFIFTCAETLLLERLADGVTGMAGLGRAKISLPSFFSSTFSFDRKFALCLSSSTSSNGVIFFGDGPYVLLPNIDVSKSLTYTKLVINPMSTDGVPLAGQQSAEYFIEVKSIKINGEVVPLNTSLLSIDKKGVGGTKISTVDPYTVMESSIYNAVLGTFIKHLSGVPRVASIPPFTACFDSTNLGSTRVGPPVPEIQLVLKNNVVWSIFGANSMVQVREKVLCLGIVDGGVEPRTAIVIGGHQVEDNLLQFDLATSRLGFSSSLLFRQTTCANFNSTVKA